MSAAITVEIVDVNGNLKRFSEIAPRELKRRLAVPVLAAAVRLQRRMAHDAPVGPDAPHIAEAVSFKQTGLRAEVGYRAEDFGGDPANESHPETWDGSLVTNALVAAFNEFSPDKQPFMRDAAEVEATSFAAGVGEALKSVERALALGGGSPFPR